MITLDHEAIEMAVAYSLAEDIHNGDITAELIPASKQTTATIITRDHAILAGQAWVEAVYRQLDKRVTAYWQTHDGKPLIAGQTIATITGPAQSILTGERCALNWLQTLSATATATARMVNELRGSQTQLLDTRKTLPGMRYAQKHAVTCGGGKNHRMGLYDAFLIKENHIASCGSITKAIQQARNNHPDKPIEVEVEDLHELTEALKAKADTIMLDNFSLEDVKIAVERNQGQAKLEYSGNVSIDRLKAIAATGVDYISVGAITKNIQAIDLSMRTNQ